MSRLIADGKVTVLDEPKGSVTYLPVGRSLIADEHWNTLRISISDEEDSDKVKDEKVRIALNVTTLEEKSVIIDDINRG